MELLSQAAISLRERLGSGPWPSRNIEDNLADLIEFYVERHRQPELSLAEQASHAVDPGPRYPRLLWLSVGYEVRRERLDL